MQISIHWAIPLSMGSGDIMLWIYFLIISKQDTYHIVDHEFTNNVITASVIVHMVDLIIWVWTAKAWLPWIHSTYTYREEW